MSKSKYVLFSDGQDFFVSKRVGTKQSYNRSPNVVGFFPTKEAAFQTAIQKTEQRIKTLKQYVKNFKKGIEYE